MRGLCWYLEHLLHYILPLFTVRLNATKDLMSNKVCYLMRDHFLNKGVLIFIEQHRI